MLKHIVDKWDIPKITNSKLKCLFKRIKPIMLNPKYNDFYYIKKVNPKKKVFIYKPKFKKSAKVGKKLIKLGQTFSLHGSHPSLWKPSMEEVLTFIQDEPYIEKVVAISIEFLAHHESGLGNIGKITMYGKIDKC